MAAAALVGAASLQFGLTAPLAASASTTGGVTVQAEVPVTGADERLQLGHNSPVLTADPTDPSFVVLASRIDNPDFGCALQLSGDRGRSWVPVRPVPNLPPGADKCYAPETAFDRTGILYYLFLGLHGQGNDPSGAYIVTSSDRGRTFSAPRQVLGPQHYMVRIAIDPTVGSRGRIHLVWLTATSTPPLGGLGPPPNPIQSAYSDDGGGTFSPPVQVSDVERQQVVAPTLALGADHALYVLYYDLQGDARDYQGLEGPTWDKSWALVVTASSDGGRTFGHGVVVDGNVVPPERVMLIYTMPPAALAVDGRRLYVSWYDARNQDWDVFLRRSSDGGHTWANPLRLNDDPIGNGRSQYMPRLSVAPGGRLDAIFYDRRNDPKNLMNDVSYTSSSDGGQTFTANVQLDSESFSSQIGTRYPIPSARGLVEFGSRIALLAGRTSSLAAWTDTRNQDIDGYGQDVFATEVDLGGSPRPATGFPVPVALAGAVVVLVVVAVGLGYRRWTSHRDPDRGRVISPGTRRSSPFERAGRHRDPSRSRPGRSGPGRGPRQTSRFVPAPEDADLRPWGPPAAGRNAAGGRSRGHQGQGR